MQSLATTPPDGLVATVLLGLNVALGAAFGLARGATVRVWRDVAANWMTQGTFVTLGLWVAAIAARIGLGFLGQGLPSKGSIALFVGVTFGAQGLVVWLRMQGATVLPAMAR